eukprot:scaffold468842_cov47-Prasinocladus_malaysianus.AAC.2
MRTASTAQPHSTDDNLRQRGVAAHQGTRVPPAVLSSLPLAVATANLGAVAKATPPMSQARDKREVNEGDDLGWGAPPPVADDGWGSPRQAKPASPRKDRSGPSNRPGDVTGALGMDAGGRHGKAAAVGGQERQQGGAARLTMHF